MPQRIEMNWIGAEENCKATELMCKDLQQWGDEVLRDLMISALAWGEQETLSNAREAARLKSNGVPDGDMHLAVGRCGL
jgi:hypothetical protein